MQRSLALILGLVLTTLSSQLGAVDMAQKPVFLNPPDPRVMLVMSRDHQLSMKAYNDYSDLTGDGVLDITYTDTVDYYGYFDSERCYTYNASGNPAGEGRFEPAGAATGAHDHECSGQWSGNFLNWASMTRMDVLRKTLYGGYRVVDNNGSALGDTVLERALLPDDVHAFAKVYAPAGGATDVAKFTPYSNASISICNVTPATSGMSSATTVRPVMQIATGSYPNWAFGEVTQCGTGGTNRPASITDTRTVRVAVCVPSKEEDNCERYGSNWKPAGLLQQYGESSAAARVRFGLLTGSYTKNKSGGVLRKNATLLSGNASAADNEIDTGTGQFINQGAADAGIINTVNRLRIAGWDYSADKHKNSCDSPGLASFSNGQCVDWGNPLAEMYLETLRYFAGEGAATAAFDTSDYLPKATSWEDPLPSTDWCALSNTVVLSTGLNSFDRDELAGHGITNLDIDALTDQVGSKEGVSGGSYLIGGNPTSDNQCTGKTLADLSDAKGICPEVPSLEGGYHLAGLAYANQTFDLRPTYQTNRTTRWGPSSSNPTPAYAARQPMSTFSVALAENLPKFEIPVSGGTISFLPSCMAQSNDPKPAITNASPPAVDVSTGWRVCSLTDVKVLSMAADGSSGSLQAAWEDSTWGNDYDMDGIAQLDYCVGAACTPAVQADQVVIKAQVVYADAGHALRFGYTVTGSDNDGTYLDILRRGNVDVPTFGPKAGVTGPTSRTFTAGTSSAKLLENPLWYAAKYARSDWDTKSNATGLPATSGSCAPGDCIPDNFFKVSNPAGLSTALGKVFEEAARADASASAIATNSTRLDTDTQVYQALFHTPGWYGELKAIPLDKYGVPQPPVWDAADEIPAAAARNITTWDGSAWTAGSGVDFAWTSLTTAQKNAIDSANASNSSSPILDYIRGDQSKEASQTNGIYRTRTTLLGDIVNSDPHYVATESYGYDQSGSGLSVTEQTTYTTFVTNAASGKPARKKVLYVGANDGMLHAFHAAATTALGGGDELFAYVPNAVIPDLKNLANPDYQHQYFVDGSPNSGDANFGTSLAPVWKTVLLGTLGAGGKAVFALDVTDPDAFDHTKVLWEFTDASDLGHIPGRAFVARMNDGNWYAVFGNGYNSPSGNAVLFMVPLDKSLAITAHKIPIDTTSSFNATDNGLSEPALLDTNGDKIIDVIYAGDLKGNVWKFDVSNASRAQWDVAYQASGKDAPLFQAKIGTAVQPVTGPLEIGLPPSGQSGYMIYFGTGKYLGNSDIISQAQLTSTAYTQTAYGILDAGSRISGGRTDLHQRTIVSEGVQNNKRFRVVDSSPQTFSYSGGGAKSGWYLDLLSLGAHANVGERIVSVPLLRHGRVVLTSIVPSGEVCAQGGYSWVTEVDALYGAGLTYSVFDIDGDGDFDASDYVTITLNGNTVKVPVSGTALDGEGLLKSPTVISAGEKEYKVGSGTAGGIVVITEKGTTGAPRASWRQLYPQ